MSQRPASQDASAPLTDMSAALQQHKDWRDGLPVGAFMRIKRTVQGCSNALQVPCARAVLAVATMVEDRGLDGHDLEEVVRQVIEFAFCYKYPNLEDAWSMYREITFGDLDFWFPE